MCRDPLEKVTSELVLACQAASHVPSRRNYYTDYTDDIALLVNTPTQGEYLLQSLEQAAGGAGLYVNADQTECMCFYQGDISTLNGCSLNLIDNVMYLGSNVSSTKSVISTHLGKVWTTVNRLSIILKFDLSNNIKRNFFRCLTVVSALLYGCTYGCWQNVSRKG